MASHVFFFGEGRAEGDPKRRDLLGGKGAGLAEMTSLGLPGSARLHDFDRSVQRVFATRAHPETLDAEVDRRARARREERRRGARRRSEAAARQRALGRARVDARHDGHDPEPRPERRRPSRGSRRARTIALRDRRVPPLRRDVRVDRARARQGTVRSRARRSARPRREDEKASTRRASTPRS